MARSRSVKAPFAPPEAPEAAGNPHLLGYARVSMADQDPRLQIDALLRAGVDEAEIWVEQASGASTRRPQFQRVLKAAQPGDVLVVWKLDRLGRNAREVLNTFHTLSERGVAIRVITQPGMDTSTAMGRLIITVMAAVAEMERDLIRERTLAGLKAARDRGVTGGRQPIANKEQLEVARRRILNGERVGEVAKSLGYKSRTTLYKAFDRFNIPRITE